MSLGEIEGRCLEEEDFMNKSLLLMCEVSTSRKKGLRLLFSSEIFLSASWRRMVGCLLL